jgi:hypothetical protein
MRKYKRGYIPLKKPTFFNFKNSFKNSRIFSGSFIQITVSFEKVQSGVHSDKGDIEKYCLIHYRSGVIKLQKNRVLCFLQLMLIIVPLFSQSDEAGIITAIEVSGLKRTRQLVTNRALQKYIGQEAVNVDLNDVRAAIMDLGILEPLEVELKEGGTGMILAVTVREKVSILPIPLFMMDSTGALIAGAFMMDMNAFGLNDKFFAGGLYLTGGVMAMASYAHNIQGKYFNGWNLGGSYHRDEIELTDQGYYSDNPSNRYQTRVRRRYSTDSVNARFGLSWALTRQLSATLRLAFDDKILRKSNNDLNPPDKNGMGISLSPALRYSRSEFDGYLMSYQSALLGYSFMAGIDYDNVRQINFSATFEKPLVPGFKMMLNAAAAFTPYTTLLFLVKPGIAPILPGGFDVFHYAGASAGLEKYILKMRFGTLSVLANYQIVETKAPDSDWQFDHGISGGIVFYLSRVAIPAVNLNVNYNVQRRFFSFSFSLGMGMGR